jgi:uncharacterized OB-fold protein
LTLPIIQQSGRRAYPPRVSALTKPFWERLAEGRFITTSCRSCNSMTFPPKAFCPGCWSKHVEWIDLPTRGRIYSQTKVHAAPAAFAREAPYRLCIMDLHAGIRIATRLVEAPEKLPLGSEAELVILMYEDGPLFAARPVRC